VVRLAPEDTGSLDVTLYVPPSSDAVSADLPRAPGRDVRRLAIHDVECDDQPIERSMEGWSLPPACNVLRYRVAFEHVPADGYDPRSRMAVMRADPSHWLVPGAALFLVPSSMRERPRLDLRLPSGMEVFHVLPGASPNDLALPVPTELAGVYFAFGAFHDATTSDGATDIRFLCDSEMEVAGIAPGMALDYLKRLTRGRAPSRVLVFVLRRANGVELTSVAGDDVIVMGHRDVTPPEEARRAASRAFLSAWLRIVVGRRVPAWVAGSLSVFYAGRALSEPAAPVGTPELALLAAQRRVAEGDLDAEAHFATDGAAFWTAVDRSIAAGSNGERSLDDVAADLLELVYTEDGTPPERFLALLTEAGAADAAALSTRWVGWPPAD
jgi:hypothetical protein